jgi:hypothetical protein
LRGALEPEHLEHLVANAVVGETGSLRQLVIRCRSMLAATSFPMKVVHVS